MVSVVCLSVCLSVYLYVTDDSIANLMADSESESPDSYIRFSYTVRLSRLVSEIFACDGRTDRQRGPLL